MLQLRSIISLADNCGAKRLMVIQVVGSSRKKYARVGEVVTAVVDKADPNGAVKDSEVVKAVIVRTKRTQGRRDGSYVRFDDNAAVVIDHKTGDPKGTRVFGPIAREVKEAGFSKIASLATEVV